MVDNVGVRPSTTSGSISVATDDIDDVHHPKYKIEFGADGTATQVDADNRLPVQTEREPLADILSCLSRIEKELKKVNLYNALAQDEEISNEDI